MKKNILICLIVMILGCEAKPPISVQESDQGYVISKGLPLTIELQTPLSSNSSVRGDIIVARLKRPITLDGKIILPKNIKIEGLVKRTTKYEQFGDQASLVLFFDHLVMPDDQPIPIVSCLDTSLGMNAIKIEGKAAKDAKMIFGSSLAGTFIGGMGPKGTGAKVAGAGAAFGTVAVLLSDMQEIQLPAGTEMTIVLREDLFIPKK